jgi:hypothetical protein
MRVGAATLLLAALCARSAGVAAEALPRTGFEKSNGSSWTTWPEERKFLRTIDRQSQRVQIENVGRSKHGRALRLVKIGVPKPHSPESAGERPTILFVCSQHGDEPAGREACLMLVRDLAYTFGQMYTRQLRESNVLVMPTANPDGIVASRQENDGRVDVNRDHLNLRSPEARAVARVAIDWRPDVVIDLHDVAQGADRDEVLYVWPRDLNVDEEVHDLSMQVGTDHIETQARANGYTSSALDSDSLEGDVHAPIDDDEGTLTNAMGLRHALALFVGSTVSEDENGDDSDAAAVNRRRVDSHYVSVLAALRFLREDGENAMQATAGAARRKTAEGRDQSAPVFFDGADNEQPSEVQDPPPCGYLLNQKQFRKVSRTMALLDIAALGSTDGVFVPMGQPAEPLIPLVLDARGWRHEVAAEPQMSC